MNAQDVLKYGQQTFLDALTRVPQSRWHDSGVCGVWSTKEVVAHIASCEVVLAELLMQLAGQKGATATLAAYQQDRDFNDNQVEARRNHDGAAVFAELQDAYERVQRLIATFAPERLNAVGTIPWYGELYSLDDFIVYAYYGHKREHAAQLNLFADRL